MKILTLGNGFVSNHLPYEKILDRVYTDPENLDYILSKQKPDVIVNCIGKTGRPNVDECETNKTETYTANVALPALIAEWCHNHNVHLIQMGSGCIFFGESPNYHYVQGNGNPIPDPIKTYSLGDPNYELYWAKSFQRDLNLVLPYKRIDNGWREEDFANPKSYYSKTKYACDLLLGQMPNVTTLRLRMPVSTKNDPRNFINKVKGYRQVIDIPNSMTIMDDLVRCVDWAAKESKFGIYHVVNPEPITAAQVMREYQKYVPSHKFEIINEEQLDALVTAKRSNCILDTSKLNEAGFFMTPSEEALKNCMAVYAENI